MGKVLLVTGQLARALVSKAVQGVMDEVEVLALPVSVAAFMTPSYIARQLKERSLGGLDAVMVPGLVRGDTRGIQEAVGIPVFKGPRHAADIVEALQLLREGVLSTSTPADVVISAHSKERMLRRIKSHVDEVASRGGVQFSIGPGGEMPVGAGLPPLVLAEIVDAPDYDTDSLVRAGRYYLESGADILDLGMKSGESNPGLARDGVALLKSTLQVPVSIDSMDPAEIFAGLEGGADLVLSLNPRLVREVGPRLGRAERERAFVLVPDLERGRLETGDRVRSLENCVEVAEEQGMRNLVADPVVDPPPLGLVRSLEAYSLFGRGNPETPMLMGIGNITEMVESDPPGLNALMALVCAELGVSMLLTTEESFRTRGAVGELKHASKVAYYASLRGSYAKGLGMTMNFCRDSKSYDEPLGWSREERVAEDTPDLGTPPDPKGYFKVSVDRSRGLIIAAHFPHRAAEPDSVVAGRTAQAVSRAVVGDALLSDLGHAAYLGRELMRAETCLKLGKSYVQDHELTFGEW